jgi:hypothetical protein
LSTNWLATDLHEKIETFKNLHANKQVLFTQSMQLCCFSIAQRKRKEQRRKNMKAMNS